MPEFSGPEHRAGLGAGFSATAPEIEVVDEADGLRIRLHSATSGDVAEFQYLDGVFTSAGERQEPQTTQMAEIAGRSFWLDAAALARLENAETGVSVDLYSWESGSESDRVEALWTEQGGERFMVTARSDGGLAILQNGAQGLQTVYLRNDTATTYAKTPSALAAAEVGGNSFVFVASESEHGLTCYQITSSGWLVPRDSIGAQQGLGINRPTDLAMQTVGVETFLLVAAAGTGTISVLAVGSDGSLSLRDHLTDDTTTRFGAVAVMETAQVGGNSFVVAGGGDDGLSLFALLPGGRLLHLESLADTYDLGLSNVNGLKLVVDGDRLHVFATSENEVGLTHVTVDTGGGVLLQGNGTATALIGGAGADQLIGTGADETISGGAGRDILLDGAGQDTLDGGAGADVFVLAADGAVDSIRDFELGLDRIDLSSWSGLWSMAQLTVSETSDGVSIGFGTETLVVSSVNGTPFGYETLWIWDVFKLYRPPLPEGDKDIVGTQAADQIQGAAGNDLLSGMEGADVLDGRDGADSLLGGADNDTLWGGARDDFLQGGTGDDHAEGGDGNDTIEGGDGRDILVGNDGADCLLGGNGGDHITGGLGDDVLNGEGALDWLDGGAGEDTLSGGIGRDSLFGGDGADLIFGNTAADWIDGGSGDDSISGGASADTLMGGDGADTLVGKTGWDSLEGGAGDDELFGGTGGDTMDGGAGHDLLKGATGSDVLRGGEGDDSLYGSNGADTLEGGAGADYLKGGIMADTFVFRAGCDQNVLADYAEAEDVLHLDAGFRQTGESIVQFLERVVVDTEDGLLLTFNGSDGVLLQNLYEIEKLYEGLAFF